MLQIVWKIHWEKMQYLMLELSEALAIPEGC